ncbi:MAG: hypothetical protein KAU83_09590 [Bacteroidales bacterium]|nr:hypothetical protein [Bacteroidales bacterium]
MKIAINIKITFYSVSIKRMVCYISRRLFAIIISLITGYLALAQSSGSFNLLFESDEILRVNILTKIDSVMKDVGENPKKHKAVLSYIDQLGKTISFKVKLSTRGNFRKDPEHCNFPPLRIDFNGKSTKNTLFEGHDWLKLVTHCMSGNPEYEQFVFKEYLIYKQYNIITPYSFRVRLLDITYLDENFPSDSIKSYAFFIERPKHVAKRNGGEILNVKNFSIRDMEEHNFTILSLFQYLIVNNDWSVELLHNIKLVLLDPFKPCIPVPYDFDWAGIIDAPYRMSLKGQENNDSDRSFTGICKSRKEMKFYFSIFNSKKQEIYDLYQNFSLLDSHHLESTLQYIDEFYSIINHTGSFGKEFRKKCLKK